jgi:hypothetical protein
VLQEQVNKMSCWPSKHLNVMAGGGHPWTVSNKLCRVPSFPDLQNSLRKHLPVNVQLISTNFRAIQWPLATISQSTANVSSFQAANCLVNFFDHLLWHHIFHWISKPTEGIWTWWSFVNIHSFMHFVCFYRCFLPSVKQNLTFTWS